MKFNRSVGAALLLGASVLAFASTASAHFADGWLSDCSAVSAGSCTEVAPAGYARQPIFFLTPTNSGILTNGQPFYFPQTTAGLSIAGRALYDAPTGGHLLAVIPWTVAQTAGSTGDRGDVGAFSISLTGYTTNYVGDAIVANYASGATLGTNATLVNGVADGAVVTTGTQLAVWRGILAADTGSLIDPFYLSTPTQTTGFTYTVPNGVTTVLINAAGTLATGAINLQAAPVDGAIQTLLCAATISTLTINVPATWTAVGTLPTACGANASHQLFYSAAAKKVYVLF